MNKKTYWQKRQELTYLTGEKKVNAYYKELQKSFEQARKEIQSAINDFYLRYAKENRVSFADAQKLLSREEIKDLKAFISKVYEHMGEYNLELNNMSIKARITRYQALEKQIDAILQQLYALEYEYKGKELLREVYSDSYYQTWYNIDMYHGFHQEFAQVNPRTIDELIKYPWNGANFSNRLWKQKDHMLQQLTESITTMLVQGKNPKTVVDQFAKKFDTKKYEAYRLLHTEGSFIIEQGTLAAYKEDDVEKYQILATLDHRTSDICREEDGKIYTIDNYTTGVNAPPYHPFCRTTTIPYYDDMEIDTRVARNENGESYEVPADMTYSEWFKQYIEGAPEALFAEKKWKNRHADKQELRRYKEVLGKDLSVSSLEDYQNLKYNNSNKFGFIKIDYSRRVKLKNNPELKLPNVGFCMIADEKFTKYLFDGNNEKGLVKGRLITKRLGYDLSNYIEFVKEIKNRASINPSKFVSTDKYGDKYEQRIIMYGKTNNPTNVVVGWKVQDGKTHMTSAYVKEVKQDED